MEKYNKKCISINFNVRHYLTVIRPAAFYAAEFLALTKVMMMEELEIAGRRI